MHTTLMILEHFAFCKTAELALHYIWTGIKRATEAALAIFVLWLLSPIFKSADQFMRGLGFVVLLTACGLVSCASIRMATAEK